MNVGAIYINTCSAIFKVNHGCAGKCPVQVIPDKSNVQSALWDALNQSPLDGSYVPGLSQADYQALATVPSC